VLHSSSSSPGAGGRHAVQETASVSTEPVAGVLRATSARRASLRRWKPRSTGVQPAQPVGSQPSSGRSDERTADRSRYAVVSRLSGSGTAGA
jgi:hypothetical protein